MAFRRHLSTPIQTCFSFKSLTKVTSLLDEAGLSYEIYADIKANPASKNVQHGVEAFKKAGADYIDRN